MKTEARIIRSWCMFDWGNSAFATTVMAAVLPIFYRNVATANLPHDQQYLATSLWGYTTATAMLLVAFLSLLLGPVADFSSSKKRFLFWFTGLGVLATIGLGFMGAGAWIGVSLLFILGNIGFAGGEVFYDSLLPHLAPSVDMDRISTRAYAYGYIGGGLLLAVNIVMIYLLPTRPVGMEGTETPVLGMQLSLASAGLWWGFFSVPLFRHVPEPPGVRLGLGGENPLRITMRRLGKTFRDIREYRQLFLFILAFWFYNDGIGTIIKMATAYGDEIGISTLDLVGALLVVQFVGIPCTFLFGKISGKLGTRQSILLGLVVYLIILIGACFMTTALHFWMLAFGVGLVQGGTQALSRSLFASIVPKAKSAEFFSFYNISGKFAGVAGPLVFGVVSQLFKTSRLGIASLFVFFIVGGLLLWKVDVEEARRIANTADSLEN